MKEQESIVTAFKEMAPRYEKLMNSELNRFWGWNYDEFVDAFLKKISFEKKGIVLDIATGTSFIPVKLFQNQVPINRIIGLDITWRMLQIGKQKISGLPKSTIMDMICGSAMHLPLAGESIDLALCGLASHHMDVKVLLAEIQRVLKNGGDVSIADVGASQAWKHPIIKLIIRTLAFIYFYFTENKSRAWAEASALTNIRTTDEWQKALNEIGYEKIRVNIVKSRRFWAPNPLLINAKKNRRKLYA